MLMSVKPASYEQNSSYSDLPRLTILMDPSFAEAKGWKGAGTQALKPSQLSASCFALWISPASGMSFTSPGCDLQPRGGAATGGYERLTRIPRTLCKNFYQWHGTWLQMATQ